MNPRSAFPLFLPLLLLLSGCPSSRPEAASQDAQAPVVSAAQAPSSPPAGTPATTASAQLVSDAGIPDDAAYLRGGTWATCMNGFRPESTLERDLIRLGMLCGPYHGMRKLGAPLTGKLAGKPVQHQVPATKGQCFRAFVIAGDPVAGLKVRATTASGTQLAQSNSSARWAVLDDQGSWCAPEDSTVTLSLESTSGQGDYAMQVWLLP